MYVLQEEMPTLLDVWCARGGWMAVGCELYWLIWWVCVVVAGVVMEHEEE